MSRLRRSNGLQWVILFGPWANLCYLWWACAIHWVASCYSDRSIYVMSGAWRRMPAMPMRTPSVPIIDGLGVPVGDADGNAERPHRWWTASPKFFPMWFALFLIFNNFKRTWQCHFRNFTEGSSFKILGLANCCRSW